MTNWSDITNKNKLKVIRKYQRMTEVQKIAPKKAYQVIKIKHEICRKTLYNWIHKFEKTNKKK